MGLTEGCRLVVRASGDPCIVEVRATRIGLARRLAERMLVRVEKGSARVTLPARRRGRPPGRRACAGAAAAADRQPQQRQDDAVQPSLRPAREDRQLPRAPPRTCGSAGCSAARGAAPVEVVDLPGLYSLDLDLPESRVARQALEGTRLEPRRRRGRGGRRHQPGPPSATGRRARARRPPLPGGAQHDRPRAAPRTLLRPRPAGRGARRAGRRRLGAARRGDGPAARRRSTPASPRPAPRASRAARRSAGDEALETWAEQVVIASVGGAHALGRPGDTVSDRLDVAFTHPVARPADLPRGDGRPVLDAVRARHRADGPDRGDLRAPRRLARSAACRRARCATCWSAA